MISRRGYLTAIGSGFLAGLAGCQGILSSGGSNGGGTLDALAARPATRRLATEDDSVSVRSSRTVVRSADTKSLREHGDEIDQGFAETGYAPWFQDEATKSAIERYDTTTFVRTTGDLADDRYVDAYCGYVEGNVQPVAYDARSEVDVEATAYGGYDLYEFDLYSVAVTESSMFEGATSVTVPDGEGDGTEELVPQVRPAIDDVEAGTEPLDPVSRGLDALRPFDDIYGGIIHTTDETWVSADSREVHGTETTVRYVWSTASQQKFEEDWDREGVIADFRESYDASDVEVETEDTLATVSATVPTATTSIAPDE